MKKIIQTLAIAIFATSFLLSCTKTSGVGKQDGAAKPKVAVDSSSVSCCGSIDGSGPKPKPK